jgi:hypothetical protein
LGINISRMIPLVWRFSLETICAKSWSKVTRSLFSALASSKTV